MVTAVTEVIVPIAGRLTTTRVAELERPGDASAMEDIAAATIQKTSVNDRHERHGSEDAVSLWGFLGDDEQTT